MYHIVPKLRHTLNGCGFKLLDTIEPALDAINLGTPRYLISGSTIHV
jgi:hypothetical protein